VRGRSIPTTLAVASAIAVALGLARPHLARPQPAAAPAPRAVAASGVPASSAAAAELASTPLPEPPAIDAALPPERLQSGGWPQPAAGASASGDPELLLTFDDGPSPLTTGKVLDILARHQVRAVFFLQGWRFERGDPAASAALVARMLREGHVIGNHTIDHARLCELDGGLRTHQILGARAILEQVSGVAVPWFRAPYGERCVELEAELERLGMRHFHWDIDPQEWRNRGPSYTAAKVIGKLTWLRGRAVLIMHDTKATTLVALPKILDWIAAENARRGKRGLRPIRFVTGAEIAAEQGAPLRTWLGRVGVEAARGLRDASLAALP
jgi:peptidoglycan/xylan/chitin deacetylase (PgdA/CDA1 family)